MDGTKPEDPRAKSNRYSKSARAKFDQDQFDFATTQFLIDDNYVGNPPSVQVSIENLNDNIDKNFLKNLLSKCGTIRDVLILRDKNDKHLGLAEVQFEEVSMAQACVDNFNNKQVMGRQLIVYKDLRFARIRKVKMEKVNPRPANTVPLHHAHNQHQLASLSSQPSTISALSSIVTPSLTNNNSSLHPLGLMAPLPFHAIQPANSSTPVGSVLPSSISNMEYPNTTPSSMISTPDIRTPHSTTSSSAHRPRLGDRIAYLMKDENHVLRNIVGTVAPQTSQPTYASAFDLNETTHYSSLPSSYSSAASSVNPNAAQKSFQDKQRDQFNNDIKQSWRSGDNNNHHHHNDRSGNHHHHKYNDNPDRYHDDELNHDDVRKSPEKKPLHIELSENQIENEVLPFCYNEFFKELGKNLLTTLFKKLRENCGYQCLEKAQTAHKLKLDKLKIQEEKKRHDQELQKQYERTFKASIVSRPEPSRHVNILRSRTNDSNMMQDTRRYGEAHPRRVNRSSALVAEPDRRGSHNTSLDSEHSNSSSNSSSSSSSSSSYSSSSTSSRSRSSSLSSGSESPYSRSSSSCSRSSFGEETSDLNRVSKETASSDITQDYGKEKILDEKDLDRLEVASALMMFKHQQRASDDVEESTISNQKPVGKKRKKVTDNECLNVASEYRPAKRFALGHRVAPESFDENGDQAMVDENFFEDRPETRYTFPKRSESQIESLYNDIFKNLIKEDIEFLKKVHEDARTNNIVDDMEFGSEEALAVFTAWREAMLDEDEKKGRKHPKWWKGCSRCDIIKVSERKVPEESTFEDLNKAEHKSSIIQVATSSRRDQRGDQRRIAVLNSNIDDKFLKMYTTSTLQMRAKNLRFSRSKIHMWGLFACEKISSGDAVIEYVGEKIRPSLADHREKNSPTHDGSSYFFRVDSDVIDATLKGNKARFINHSCNPNCYARVIKHDNGTNSIVIYAKQSIKEDEEITYDYKFPREEGVEKIVCRCKAPNCQKYLN